MPMIQKARQWRKKSLDAQKKLRDWIRKKTKRKLRGLLTQRKRLLAQGKSTKEIDAQIRVMQANMQNESVYAVASLLLTPVEDLQTALKAKRMLK